MAIETREVGAFHEIESAGNIQVTFEQIPESRGQVMIEAHADLLPRLLTEVRGGRLLLRYDVPWWEWAFWWFQWIAIPDKTIRMQVQGSRLENVLISGSGSFAAGTVHSERLGLVVSGSGKMMLEAVETPHLQLRVSGSGDICTHRVRTEAAMLEISGSGNVEVAGTALQQTIRISGSGDVRAEELVGEQIAVSISGSGGVRVNAGRTLEVELSGSGEVRYAGQPQVTERISGSGRVVPLNR